MGRIRLTCPGCGQSDMWQRTVSLERDDGTDWLVSSRRDRLFIGPEVFRCLCGGCVVDADGQIQPHANHRAV